MNIAIIPARAGSKRIPRKNIKLFADKPMIGHAIGVAKDSGLFDRVLVSTDSREIAELANKWGAETPFLRPQSLADDHTPTVPVVVHAIEACESMGWEIDLVCCLYPGCPLIQVDDLAGALELLHKRGAEFSFPVMEFPSAVQRALSRDESGRMAPFYPEFESVRTQDLEKAYHDAGQFYWGTRIAWLDNLNIHSRGFGYPVPNWRVVDIDNAEDWQRAEFIFKYIRG